MTIAREGLIFVIPSAILAAVFVTAAIVVGSLPLQIAAVVFGLLFLIMLFFFREPAVETECKDWQIVSPADGVVLTVDAEVPPELPDYTSRLSIFLSVLDVHVNRVPAAGRVESVYFRQGKKFSAFRPQASTHNQRSEIELRTNHGMVHFRQITGSLARRVVFSLKAGQDVAAGERFGVMRFGSRMDLFFPSNVRILVSKKDRVMAGRSVIAEFEA